MTSQTIAAAQTAAASWDEWVAIGTLALAGVTVLAVAVGLATARSTKRAADAAQASADADKRALQGAIRPLIIHTRRANAGRGSPKSGDFETVVFPGGTPEPVLVGGIGVFARSETITEITVPLRNVGQGLALVTASRFASRDKGWVGDTGTPLDIVIPREESTRIEFRPNYPFTGEFQVEVSYTDARGSQPMRTRLAIRQKSPTLWEVVGLKVLEDEPGAGGQLLAKTGDWPNDLFDRDQET